MMKYFVRVLTFLVLLAGCSYLVYQSLENAKIAGEVKRLESELGRMPITDIDRVHLVEVAQPEVPPEIAPHLKGIWQFRGYLPPNYDYVRFSGGGRVTKEGLYHSGGHGSSWGGPPPNAIHELLTISLQKKDNRLEVFYSFGGTSGTTSWNVPNLEQLDDLVTEKLVSSERGPRSFDRNTILPLLKVYDPSTAEEEVREGKSITTYAGGLFVLCPKSREAIFNRLLSGESPEGYDPSWIGAEATDE